MESGVVKVRTTLVSAEKDFKSDKTAWPTCERNTAVCALLLLGDRKVFPVHRRSLVQLLSEN